MRSLLVGFVAVTAVVPAQAQAARELQLQGLATVTGARFLGGGLGVGLRSRGRTRAGLTVSAGDVDGRFGGRVELLLSYHANPFKRHGVTPYAAGGAAVTVTGSESAEYIVLAIGMETNPGGRAGWFAELGVAGGVRVSSGLRLRHRARRRRNKGAPRRTRGFWAGGFTGRA